MLELNPTKDTKTQYNIIIKVNMNSHWLIATTLSTEAPICILDVYLS